MAESPSVEKKYTIEQVDEALKLKTKSLNEEILSLKKELNIKESELLDAKNDFDDIKSLKEKLEVDLNEIGIKNLEVRRGLDFEIEQLKINLTSAKEETIKKTGSLEFELNGLKSEKMNLEKEVQNSKMKINELEETCKKVRTQLTQERAKSSPKTDEASKKMQADLEECNLALQKIKGDIVAEREKNETKIKNLERELRRAREDYNVMKSLKETLEMQSGGIGSGSKEKPPSKIDSSSEEETDEEEVPGFLKRFHREDGMGFNTKEIKDEDIEIDCSSICNRKKLKAIRKSLKIKDEDTFSKMSVMFALNCAANSSSSKQNFGDVVIKIKEHKIQANHFKFAILTNGVTVRQFCAAWANYVYKIVKERGVEMLNLKRKGVPIEFGAIAFDFAYAVGHPNAIRVPNYEPSMTDNESQAYAAFTKLHIDKANAKSMYLNEEIEVTGGRTAPPSRLMLK